MDWFKEFIKSLPLEEISEKLAKLVMWWSEKVQDVPADELPLRVYLGGSIIVCLLWFFIARLLPRSLGIMSWIILIAILFTPAVALGNNGEIVPACVAIVYAILMKNTHDVVMNILPILSVIITSFFLVFMWHILQLILIQNNQQEPIYLTTEVKTFVKSNTTKLKPVITTISTKIKPFLKTVSSKVKSFVKFISKKVHSFIKAVIKKYKKAK